MFWLVVKKHALQNTKKNALTFLFFWSRIRHEHVHNFVLSDLFVDFFFRNKFLSYCCSFTQCVWISIQPIEFVAFILFSRILCLFSFVLDQFWHIGRRHRRGRHHNFRSIELLYLLMYSLVNWCLNE